MKGGWVCLACLLLLTAPFAFAVENSRKFVTPAFRGRGYGSPSSNEVSRKIAIGEDGYIYIAGTTTVSDANETAWGDTDDTAQTAGVDVFLAKVDPLGSLKWAKRIGSTRDETLNDLKLYDDTLYVCGTTTGDLGKPVNGSSDAFVMKFSTTGDKLWKRAFQFGSSKGDSCKGIDLDKSSGTLYAVGSTEGDLFESSRPAMTGTHDFIVKLEDPKFAEAGMHLGKARQGNSERSSSTDNVAVTKDNVICMTVSWNSTAGETRDRAVTNISKYNRDTLQLQQADTVTPSTKADFQGLDMDVVAGTGDAFVVGTTNLEDGRKGYYIIAYSSTANAGKGGVLWETFLGYASPELKLRYHSPAVSADPEKGLLYIAGTEEGVFFNKSTEISGIMILPFFEVNITTGVIIQKWQRATPLSTDRQELTDLAHNGRGAVIFTGLWDEGPNETTQALVGSYGSVASRTDATTFGRPGILVSEQENSKDIHTLQDPSKMFLIVGASLATLFLLATITAQCRSRQEQRFQHIMAAEVEDDDIETQKKLAAGAYPVKSPTAVERDENVAESRVNLQ